MSSKIFVNLPVKDLAKSKEFFLKLGYNFDARFTDDKNACLVISDSIYAMLLNEDFFKNFTKREITDPRKANECMLAISLDSREAVDQMLERAIAAGANEYKKADDHGFMYERDFEDLDGHIWSMFWMDISKMQNNA